MKLLLILAQLAVFEASFTTTNEDAAAIIQVLRARGLLHEEGIHKYAPHFRRARYREWIHNLDFSGNEPEGWPRTLLWSDYRGSWFRTIAATARGLSGYRPCPEDTLHYGAPGFRADYWLSRRWTVEQCGGTRNWFWRRPQR